MPQCATGADLIFGAGLGLNARMSTDSNTHQGSEQAGDGRAKTIPRLALIRDALCNGSTERFAECLELSVPSAYRIMREGIARRAARRLEARLGLPIESIYPTRGKPRSSVRGRERGRRRRASGVPAVLRCIAAGCQSAHRHS